MFKSWKVDREYRELCAAEFMHDSRISESASLLVLVKSGVVLSDDIIVSMADRLSSLAEEHGLSPEDVQSALMHNEPILGTSTLDF